MYSEVTERFGLIRQLHPNQRFRHRDIALLALLATLGPASAAQTSSSTRATQLPLSGYQQGRPSVQQSAVPSASSSTNTVNKAPIEANRSLVELQTEQQRLRSQLGDLQKQKNILARLIGLPLNLDLQITEKLHA